MCLSLELKEVFNETCCNKNKTRLWSSHGQEHKGQSVVMNLELLLFVIILWTVTMFFNPSCLIQANFAQPIAFNLQHDKSNILQELIKFRQT